jgi:hypothetical protein
MRIRRSRRRALADKRALPCSVPHPHAVSESRDHRHDRTEPARPCAQFAAQRSVAVRAELSGLLVHVDGDGAEELDRIAAGR